MGKVKVLITPCPRCIVGRFRRRDKQTKVCVDCGHQANAPLGRVKKTILKVTRCPICKSGKFVHLCPGIKKCSGCGQVYEWGK